MLKAAIGLAVRESSSDDLSAAAKGAWLPSVSLFGQMQYSKIGDEDPIVVANNELQNDYAVGLRFSESISDAGFNHRPRERS